MVRRQFVYKEYSDYAYDMFPLIAPVLGAKLDVYMIISRLIKVVFESIVVSSNIVGCLIKAKLF